MIDRKNHAQPPHAPGPWHVEDQMSLSNIVDQNGRIIAMVALSDRFKDDDANALLIAGAPELLAAAKAIVDDVDDWGETLQFHYTLIDALKAAVQRATS